jgi:hypothetical protein
MSPTAGFTPQLSESPYFKPTFRDLRGQDFFPSHPFFNLLCTFWGGQVFTQGQLADLLDHVATRRIPTAEPFEIKGIEPGFWAIP